MYIYKSKFTNDTFLKNAHTPLAKRFISEINESCDKFRKTPIKALKLSKFRLFDEIGERAKYQEDYYERRRRLTIFFLRVWLFHEKDDISELEDILWSVCDEYTWALPAHLGAILRDENIVPNRVDLFAAETAHTIAEALSLCSEYLHPAVVRRCVSEVFKRVILPYESGDVEKYGLWWDKSGTNNWSAVCGGAVGMTAIYLIEDDERLNKLLERTKFACNTFIDTCSDDGICKEGLSYWTYAVQYYVGLDELMKERTGKGIVENEEKIKRLARFPSVVCLAENCAVKFSDFSDTHLFYGILCKLHERYGVPIPSSSFYRHITDRCARTCGAVRTIAWYNPDLANDNDRTDDMFFELGEWAVLHKNGMCAVIKGGHNKEPHNHNDVGSYMFIKGNDIIADELGAAKYVNIYFDEALRYGFLNAGSQGHSLPIVNGCFQKAGIEYAADSFERIENGVRVSFANAYGKETNLKKLTRELSLKDDGVWIKDKFEFTKSGNSVKERVVTEADAKILSESKVLISQGARDLATLEFSEKGKISISHDSFLMPNPTGRSDVYGSEDKEQSVTLIDLEATTETDVIEITYTIN